MRYLPLFARILLCVIFFYGSISNLLEFNQTQQFMTEKGLPIPAVLLAGNIVFQLVGAISLLLGFKVQWGSIILILFLIPTTLVFHNFWANPDETVAFLKNVGLMGGLLLLIQTGAGPVGLDGENRNSTSI